jgi:hypothetical protein
MLDIFVVEILETAKVYSCDLYILYKVHSPMPYRLAVLVKKLTYMLFGWMVLSRK